MTDVKNYITLGYRFTNYYMQKSIQYRNSVVQ